jgi:hypothetical protein
MNADSAFASPLVRKVGGEDVEFARLTMQDYGALEGAVRSRRLELARAVMEDVEGVSPKDRLDALRQEAGLPVLLRDVLLYICTADGARRACEMSLKRAGNKEFKAVLDRMDIMLAADVAGITLGLIDDPEAKPDPTAGGATGKPTPPCSDGSTPESTPAD